MKRLLGTLLPLSLSFALGCGGGDKKEDTTPAANQMGAPATGDQGAAATGDQTAPATGDQGAAATGDQGAAAAGDQGAAAAGDQGAAATGDKGAAAGDQGAAAATAADQVAMGAKVWSDSCAVCHGDKGQGKKKSPPVVGKKAVKAWKKAKAKSAADLYGFVKTKMPKDDPGSLTYDQYLAVTAWMLKQNGKLTDTDPALTAEASANVKLY